MYFQMIAIGFGLILGGCTVSGAVHTGGPDNLPQRNASMRPADSSFTLAQMDSYVDKTSGLDATGRQNEVRRLQANTATDVNDRLKLAYLLSLEDASLDDLGQAQAQLEGLDAAFGDKATRLYVRLLQRTVAMDIACKQEKKRADGLQEKLKQIKDLELELMKRSQTQPAQGK